MQTQYENDNTMKVRPIREKLFAPAQMLRVFFPVTLKQEAELIAVEGCHDQCPGFELLPTYPSRSRGT